MNSARRGKIPASRANKQPIAAPLGQVRCQKRRRLTRRAVRRPARRPAPITGVAATGPAVRRAVRRARLVDLVPASAALLLLWSRSALEGVAAIAGDRPDHGDDQAEDEVHLSP